MNAPGCYKVKPTGKRSRVCLRPLHHRGRHHFVPVGGRRWRAHDLATFAKVA